MHAMRVEKPVLLLDVMETLVTEPFLVHVPGYFGMSLEELLRDKDPQAWIDFEHGLIDEATYTERFFRDRRKVDLGALKKHMIASYAWMEGVEPLLAELKAHNVAMHALSNYSSWYQLIDEKLSVSRYVEWTFVSCKTGVRKPHPEAYLGAARMLGVDAAACVFVDDRARNVDAARAVGMHAILRPRAIADLRSELVRCGCLGRDR
jgi:HAD superfamily hydrolase (TIGR01509 family)